MRRNPGSRIIGRIAGISLLIGGRTFKRSVRSRFLAEFLLRGFSFLACYSKCPAGAQGSHGTARGHPGETQAAEGKKSARGAGTRTGRSVTAINGSQVREGRPWAPRILFRLLQGGSAWWANQACGEDGGRAAGTARARRKMTNPRRPRPPAKASEGGRDDDGRPRSWSAGPRRWGDAVGGHGR